MKRKVSLGNMHSRIVVSTGDVYNIMHGCFIPLEAQEKTQSDLCIFLRLETM